MVEAARQTRPQDLVVLLDGLQEREAAVREDIAGSEAGLRRLRAAGGTSAAALEEARTRAGALAVRLALPYRIRTLGDPPTLAAALTIPGGVVDTARLEAPAS